MASEVDAGLSPSATVAELIATGRTPGLIHPFRLSRFAEFDPVGEKGAAAVGH